jgi:hypothetical protein
VATALQVSGSGGTAGEAGVWHGDVSGREHKDKRFNCTAATVSA